MCWIFTHYFEPLFTSKAPVRTEVCKSILYAEVAYLNSLASTSKRSKPHFDSKEHPICWLLHRPLMLTTENWQISEESAKRSDSQPQNRIFCKFLSLPEIAVKLHLFQKRVNKHRYVPHECLQYVGYAIYDCPSWLHGQHYILSCCGLPREHTRRDNLHSESDKTVKSGTVWLWKAQCKHSDIGYNAYRRTASWLISTISAEVQEQTVKSPLVAKIVFVSSVTSSSIQSQIHPSPVSLWVCLCQWLCVMQQPVV